MVTYHSLITVDLTPLSEAVGKWRTLPGKFRQVGTNLRTEVQTPLTNSDWEGEAADSAFTRMQKAAKEIELAACEAEDVHGLLHDAYTAFKGAKKKLQEYKKEIEEAKHLAIDDTGHVSYKPTNLDDLTPMQQGLQAKNFSEVVGDYNGYISEVVANATTTDEILAWALTQDGNGRKEGFSADGYNSTKDAKAGREQAGKDLKEVEKLVRSKKNLSPTEIARANTLLSRHEGDPYFSEKFATDLGAKDTLEFWQHVTNGQQFGDERTKNLEKLQKSLGYTLATASHSDSDEMKQWKKEVIKLGPQRVMDTDWEAGTRDPGSYGFQVMSSLLRYGEYDKDFLVDYGKGYPDPHSKDGRTGGLFEFDRKHKDDLKDLYWPDGYETYVNFGEDNDHGVDPMAGYMESLGHNPEAAQTIFHRDRFEQDARVPPNDDLMYLLKERKWLNGNFYADDGKGYGYDELGHAFEAAALGHPYDQPELGLHRNPASVNVATQLISVVGDNSGILADKAGLSDSLARVGAGYIDNLDWATANHGDAESGAKTRDAAFGALGPSDISVANETAKNFLSAVGRDDGGYQILSAAQHDFTTNVLKAHPNADDPLTLALGTGAETQGILDEARSDAIMSDANDSKEEKARKLSEAGEWQKYRTSTGISTVTSLVTVPFEAAKATPFVTPFVDAATGAIDTQTGINIDREIEKQQKEFDAKVDADAHNMQKKFVEASQRRSVNPLDAYIAAHPGLDDSPWYNEASERVKAGYIRGVGDAQLTGSGS
ncbi:hypothetical protein ACWDWU_22745 [Streptomyces sp. NPDC003442]